MHYIKKKKLYENIGGVGGEARWHGVEDINKKECSPPVSPEQVDGVTGEVKKKGSSCGVCFVENL